MLTNFIFLDLPVIVIRIFQDFKFRLVLLSAFRRKKRFTSFRTSMRSSFGSSRYRNRLHSKIHTSSLYQPNSSSEQAKTVESDIKNSLTDSLSHFCDKKGGQEVSHV